MIYFRSILAGLLAVFVVAVWTVIIIYLPRGNVDRLRLSVSLEQWKFL